VLIFQFVANVLFDANIEYAEFTVKQEKVN
jgi:hypothetical protein